MIRACPVCGSVGARETLHRQRFLEGPLGAGYDVVVCEGCGAGFADGIPGQADLDRYYAERSKYVYAERDGAESPYDFKRFNAIVEQVMPFAPSRHLSILDVGCATGGLLACFAQRGYTRLLGSDPSPACVAAAQKLHGIEVKPATVAELGRWEERFDLILLVGVLEHLRDVGPAVEIVSRLLTPDGLVYCAQPDVEAFARCHNSPFQQFSIEHVNFFSEQSLVRLMGRGQLARKEMWRWMIEWREGVTDSVVSGLFHRTAGLPEAAFDHGTRDALQQYIAQCLGSDRRLLPVIDELVLSREPVLIWGAGTLARRLLSSTRLAEANITGFVDTNPHMQGKRLAGREIFAPEQIIGHTEAIVICSKAFEREIIAMIRTQLRLPNSLKTLPY